MDNRIKAMLSNLFTEDICTGDTVVMVFWDGCFNGWFGKIKKDEYNRNYIECGNGSIGYEENADATYKAVEQDGWALWADTEDINPPAPGEKNPKKWLWGAPLMQDNSLDDENVGMMQSSCIEPEFRHKLEKVASQLNCELY